MATLSLAEGAGAKTLLSWGSVSDATGYLLHRWVNPDRSGEDHSRHLAVPSFEEEGSPRPGETWFFEVGSTNACGETMGEFSAVP